jgi:hypothetical protein
MYAIISWVPLGPVVIFLLDGFATDTSNLYSKKQNNENEVK